MTKKNLSVVYPVGDRVEAIGYGYDSRGPGVVVGHLKENILVMHDNWDRGHNGSQALTPKGRALRTKLNACWYYNEKQIQPINTDPVETNPWWDK